MDGSIIFARWRQCAPHLIRASLGPPESTFQTAPQSAKPFCTDHGKVSPYFKMSCSFRPQNNAFTRRLWTPSNTLLLGSLEFISQTTPWSVQPFLPGSQLWQTDRQTDRPCYSITVVHIYICNTAMRPNNTCIFILPWRANFTGGGRKIIPLLLWYSEPDQTDMC